MEVLEVPYKPVYPQKGPGWWTHVGNWSVRIDCPSCNQFEAWMLFEGGVDPEGKITDLPPCRGCGVQPKVVQLLKWKGWPFPNHQSTER